MPSVAWESTPIASVAWEIGSYACVYRCICITSGLI